LRGRREARVHAAEIARRQEQMRMMRDLARRERLRSVVDSVRSGESKPSVYENERKGVWTCSIKVCHDGEAGADCHAHVEDQPPVWIGRQGVCFDAD
jgi:hypothetical protein